MASTAKADVIFHSMKKSENIFENTCQAQVKMSRKN